MAGNYLMGLARASAIRHSAELPGESTSYFLDTTLAWPCQIAILKRQKNLKTPIEAQINNHGRRQETANAKPAFHPLGEGSEAKCIVIHSCPSAVFFLLIHLQLPDLG